MQKLIYVSQFVGNSKKGTPLNLMQVSNGLATFTLNVDTDIQPEILDLDLNQGDEFMAEVHVGDRYGALSGTVVKVERA